MEIYTYESSGAFVDTFTLAPHQTGLLDNLTFAVKDNIDIAGYKTSYGSKPWRDGHPTAVNHAVCVEQLLNAGATCLGKTISDEYTCSLDGESYWYGTPVNPKAPDYIPGGSSSGSASAVACNLVDFALGTDCAGSIRVPASICGIWGMRPSLHRISESGVLPFVPSVSTVGAFASTLPVLDSVMKVLLSTFHNMQATQARHIYFLEDAFTLTDKSINDALSDSISTLQNINSISTSFISLEQMMGEQIDLFTCNEEILRVIQSIEVWNAIGSWITDHNPKTGPRITMRLADMKETDRNMLSHALERREDIYKKVFEFLGPGDLICFPTIPVLTPQKGQLDNFDTAMEFYRPTMAMTSFAGAARLPEISIPVTKANSIPVGLSLVAANQQDLFLLDACKQLFG